MDDQSKVKKLPIAEPPAGSGASPAGGLPAEGLGLSKDEIFSKVGELYLLRDKLIEKVTALEQKNINLKIELQNLRDSKGAKNDKQI